MPSSGEPIAMSWSGGKDSSFALYTLMKDKRYRVVSLLTTITKEFDRISMHGVRRELLNRQSRSIEIPVLQVEITYRAGNEEYERKMKEAVESLKSQGISKVAFGDIYLEDIRRYREEKMAQAGMSCIFPLWGYDPGKLSRKIIESGFRATICTVDPKKIGKEYAGKDYSLELIESLPKNVDPCGEKGEFHTFAYNGPIFKSPVGFVRGEVVERDGFFFADLIPV